MAEVPGVFGIDAGFKQLNRRLDELNRKVDDVVKDGGALLRQSSELRQQLTRWERKMADQVSDLREAIGSLTSVVSEVGTSAVAAIDRLSAKIGNQPDLAQDITDIRSALTRLQDTDALLDAAGVDVHPTPGPEPARKK